MPFVEFTGQSRSDSDFRTADTSQLINCYREPMDGEYVIKAVPGTAQFVDLQSVFMRALETVGGDIYAATGGALFKVESLGNLTNLGAVADGDTTIAGNNGKVAVAADGTYYVWNGTSLTTPTGGAFTAAGSVEFLAQTTIITEKNGRRFQWSAVADAESLNGLDFATAEGRDDNILRGVMVNGNLWLMKEASCEVWYPTASGFSRIAGGVLDTGLKAFGLVAKFDGGAFFVGDDGIAYITNGAGLQPVSTPSVETDISQGSPERCFYYEDEGHKFCAINFGDRPAWVYDISTGEWHNRAAASGSGSWRVVESVKAFGFWHVGTDTGRILRLGRFNVDIDGPLVRRMTSKTLITGKNTTLSRLEIYGRAGEAVAGGDITYCIGGFGFVLTDNDGLALFDSVETGTERQPQVVLRMSRDFGNTWTEEKWRSWGAVGKYASRVEWRSLGRARQHTAELTISDPVELPVKSSVFLEVA